MTRASRMEPQKLINYLRAEIGMLIESWIIYNIYRKKTQKLQTEDLRADARNQNLNVLNTVKSKFRDDLILRLSELSQRNHGRLNFHFASDKWKIQKDEATRFTKYLEDTHIIFRRNKNIAHKEISPSWKEIDARPHIKNSTLIRAVVWSISLMKGFDKKLYGEQAKDIWKEERRIRYEFHISAGAKYMMLPELARVNMERG